MPTKSNPSGSERLLLDPATIGAPDVLLVGRYHYRSAHPPLLAHAHEGVLELCFLERGRQVHSFADGAVHCLRVPPAEFLRVLRLEHAQLRLRTTRDAITDVALDAGFSSSQHFAAAFRQYFGCTPREFRRRSTEPIRETEFQRGAGVGFHPTASAT